MRAIEDEKIKVNLYTTRADKIKSKNGKDTPILIGAYEGSVINYEYTPFESQGFADGASLMDDGNGTWEIASIVTEQYINMEHSRLAEAAGVSTQGTDVLHELMESFYGAIDAPGIDYDPKSWNKSHNKALEIDKGAERIRAFFSPSTNCMSLRNPQKGTCVGIRDPLNEQEKNAWPKGDCK